MTRTLATAHNITADKKTGASELREALGETSKKTAQAVWALARARQDNSLPFTDEGVAKSREIERMFREESVKISRASINRADIARRTIEGIKDSEKWGETLFENWASTLAVDVPIKFLTAAAVGATRRSDPEDIVKLAKDMRRAERAAETVEESTPTTEPDTDDSGAGEPVEGPTPREANPVEVYLSQARTSALIDELISRVKSGKLGAETMAEVEAFAAYVSELDLVSA